jgi:glycerol-3-phosphate O-acyltransferase
MIHITETFRRVTEQLLKNSREQQEVDRERVFQEANMANRPLVETIISRLLLPGSHIDGYEHLRLLHSRSQSGKSCLLLLEHYSNFDIPCLFYLAKEHDDGDAVTESIVAMAGTKLNEASKFVLAFTEAYTRIVIYPARMLAALEGSVQYDAERTRSRTINRSALREMIRVKHSGHMILLFPAGTRYRPGKPETKSILKEVDSYIKGFDSMVFIGIAGNTLEVDVSGDMERDIPRTDVVVYSVSEVTDCAAFRNEARGDRTGEEAKQAVASSVGARLDELHERAAQRRSRIVSDLHQSGVDPEKIELNWT